MSRWQTAKGSATLAVIGGSAWYNTCVRDSASTRRADDSNDESGIADPFKLRKRFVSKHRTEFAGALGEIKRGRKDGHWSWYIWPTPPHVCSIFGFDMEISLSPMNRYYALRDPPPDRLRGDKAAAAYITFPEVDGVDLRRNYITMMQVVASQLEGGVSPRTLAGEADVPKLVSSLLLFERVSRGERDDELNETCRRALSALGVTPKDQTED